MDYRIEISSDLDYDKMVVDILYMDNQLAKLNCDEGIEKTKIVLYDKENEKPIWELDFSLFNIILSKALDKLKIANSIK